MSRCHEASVTPAKSITQPDCIKSAVYRCPVTEISWPFGVARAKLKKKDWFLSPLVQEFFFSL